MPFPKRLTAGQGPGLHVGLSRRAGDGGVPPFRRHTAGLGRIAGLTRFSILAPTLRLHLSFMRPERMRMYQAAEQLMAEVEKLLPRAKAEKPNAAKHLESSAESVLYNSGEGIGSYKPKVKIAAYSVARKEANEVRAILRRLVIGRVFLASEVGKAMALAGAVIAMLTNAIIALEKRAQEEDLGDGRRKDDARKKRRSDE